MNTKRKRKAKDMKEEKYGRHRTNSYPKHYHREPLPMFYLTLLSSSSGGSVSESPDVKRKQDNKTKKNEDSGALFQCQELDGGNAIECKFGTNYFFIFCNERLINLLSPEGIMFFFTFVVIYPFCHVASDAEDMFQIGAIPSSIIAGLSIQRIIKGE